MRDEIIPLIVSAIDAPLSSWFCGSSSGLRLLSATRLSGIAARSSMHFESGGVGEEDLLSDLQPIERMDTRPAATTIVLMNRQVIVVGQDSTVPMKEVQGRFSSRFLVTQRRPFHQDS